MSAMPHDSSNALLASAAAQPTYRDYSNNDKPVIDRVRTFYRNNYPHRTYDFVVASPARTAA
jgi:hypothetical protein